MTSTGFSSPPTFRERTQLQRFVSSASWFYIASGLAGFARPVTRGGTGAGPFRVGRTKLLGIFATNAPHNLLHIAMGVMGLSMANDHKSAQMYARMSGSMFAMLALAGLFTKNLIGLIALNRADSVLHTGLAAFSFFAANEAAPRETASAPEGSTPSRSPNGTS